MSEFYRRELFEGIPYINMRFADSSELGSSDGKFILVQNDDYEEAEDELYDTPGYRTYFSELDEGLIYAYGEEPSWSDPANHPKYEILISKSMQRNDEKVVGTLLHELVHYYCWYRGLGHGDSDKDFIEKATSLGLPINHIHHAFENGRWKDTFDYSLMDKYIRLYKDSTKGKKA